MSNFSYFAVALAVIEQYGFVRTNQYSSNPHASAIPSYKITEMYQRGRWPDLKMDRSHEGRAAEIMARLKTEFFQQVLSYQVGNATIYDANKNNTWRWGDGTSSQIKRAIDAFASGPSAPMWPDTDYDGPAIHLALHVYKQHLQATAFFEQYRNLVPVKKRPTLPGVTNGQVVQTHTLQLHAIKYKHVAHSAEKTNFHLICKMQNGEPALVTTKFFVDPKLAELASHLQFDPVTIEADLRYKGPYGSATQWTADWINLKENT